MNRIVLTEVGYTKKPKGISGQIKIHIDDNYLDDVRNARAIFIDLNGSRVPFLIEKFIADSHLMIKLDEVDTPQDAELYAARTVYLDVNEVTAIESSESTAHPLVGYIVTDQDNNMRGHINSIEEYPNQLMSFITNGDSTIMLPVHEDNIIHLDETNKCIQIDIPQGLEDLYI